MATEAPRDDQARGGGPVQVSIHVALEARHRHVWLEVDLDGKRVLPETARGLSSLLVDMATVAEKLRGNQPDSNNHVQASSQASANNQVTASNQAAATTNQAATNNQTPAAAMPAQWQEVNHDEPRYTGPAQAPTGTPPAAPANSAAAQQDRQ